MLANELLKFRRSHFGVILLLIPGLSILLAAMNYQLNLRVLTPGWPSFLGQTTLFYGMLFMNVGIAILAATAWRREHKDNNATFLLTSPRTRGSIVVAKAGVLIVLVAVMQTVFFLLALAVGFILKVPGHPPLDVAVILLLAIIPGAAVAVWQSWLSMMTKSFTLPIVVAAGVSIAGAVLLAADITFFDYLLPPALVSRVMFAAGYATTGGSTDPVVLVGYLVASGVLAVVGLVASAWWLRRADR
ncbi:ABC transporter permease [Corynebacterium cystitidis]|uniref:ABC transporter permease n=1 Tax=Corynebacterium cystitidis TaxID=35757 RepID=UPI00211E1B5E|nr:ABC transporter permease [Corynebacterium cystitidis]